MQNEGSGCHSTPMVDSSDIANPAWLRRGVVVLYAFLFLCVVSGITWVYYSAYQGQIFHAVIGAAIAIGGSGVALVKLLLMRIGSIVVRNSLELDRIDRRMEIIEHQLNQLIAETNKEVDLSAVGEGKPEKLAAASLATSTFPRLLPQDDKPVEFPPTRTETIEEPEAEEPDSLDVVEEEQIETDTKDQPGDTNDQKTIETRWQKAFEANDLAACSSVLSAAEEVLSEQQIASMQQWLDGALRDRRKQYRESFARSVREERFDEAVSTGQKILRDFPESGMADEYRRIEPHLLARADQQKKTSRSSTG